ncbi:MAG: ABC transporter substrate-binding protein [Alphaproteobacteria bacterium]|nr:ABC transporter substrate-binding protein [Alphaproteobacteria bacterium]
MDPRGTPARTSPARPAARLSRRALLRMASIAAAAVPARALGEERMRILGLLTGLPLSDPLMSRDSPRSKTLFGDLARSGWIEGRNLRVEMRSSAGGPGARETAVRELIALKPDVVITVSSTETAALLAQTRTIPIVFATAGDPVGSGFVESLARPGGNATGFVAGDAEPGCKLLQFLREASPRLSRVGVFLNPLSSPRGGRYYLDPIESAAIELGLKVTPVHLTDPSQIEAAVAAYADGPESGIAIPIDSFLVAHRRVLVEAMTRYRVPAIYPYRYFMEVGGLMSYGPSLEVRAAEYVDLILRGAKPAELPVQSPRRYELLINRKAAQALGLILPLSLLARADQIIE